MKLILHYTYRRGGTSSALDTLHELAQSSADAILCRVRRSKNNVLIVYPESTMAQLCSYEERVDELQFNEIDALMQLCGYHVLTLSELIDKYQCNTPLILHFRSFRPDASVVSRVVRDPRFSFGTDSVDQLNVIANGFPSHKAIGFASHLPAAQAMANVGASVICMYGRDAAKYTAGSLAPLAHNHEIWMELPRQPEEGLDEAMETAQTLGCSGIVLPLEFLR